MSDSIILTRALQWSPALARQVNQSEHFKQWLETACSKAITPGRIQKWFLELNTNCAGNTGNKTESVAKSLRLLRQRVFYSLMVRDICQLASLSEVLVAMSYLADLSVQESYSVIAQELEQQYGQPINPATQRPQELIVVAMGKLGGYELNVSSDIDLVMLYASDGETSGPDVISNQEFYNKTIRQLSSVLSDFSEYGFVFRCDFRLRPDGNTGPLAWGLKAFENYLVLQGREWERYAWIKARNIPVKAFSESDSNADIEKFEAIRRPFVYRKYLDFDALESLRNLRQRIRQDWEQRARTRRTIDKTHNIKLGDGGIREIEFIVQLNQLIRGGKMPSLQHKNLQRALEMQMLAEIIPPATADGLEKAWIFMRRLEHLLQYREDEQTHMLPTVGELRNDLANAMGMNSQEFESTLHSHREFVSNTFRSAFRLAGIDMQPDDSNASVHLSDTNDTQSQNSDNNTLLEIDSALKTFKNRRRIKALPKTSQTRLQKVITLAKQEILTQSNPIVLLNRFLDLMLHAAPRSSYLALLSEYPHTIKRIIKILDFSPWAAAYLSQHPLLLDSLIEWQSLLEGPDFDKLAVQLRTDLDASTLPDGSPDIEQQMNLMRDMQHETTFQLLAQDLEGELTVEALADRLSELADLILEESIHRAWNHTITPRFAVIAYGKLGGKELGYASDLDLVFIYDDHEDTSSLYTRLGRRMVSWLSTMTSSGRLYDVDLRLRPDGESGLLAVSMQAFEQYQIEHAWTWEHQALTRARFAAGDIQIGQRFENLRARILTRKRNLDKLRQDILTMREKISNSHPNKTNLFDIKHDAGGMVDIEFIVQYLVLGHSCEHPILVKNLGNIALLGLAANCGLIPKQLADSVANAYRLYRSRQHALRLQGAERARVEKQEFATSIKYVGELWQYVFKQQYL